MTFRVLALGLAAATMAAPLDLRVYSEFRRVDPFGEIIPQDRRGSPREILSPLLARNAHATFRVVVEAAPGQHFYLFVGTYPEGVLPTAVYKEMWGRDGDAWVPERLVQVALPYLSHIPDRYHGLPNQTVEVFLVDVFVPASIAPGRMKLEPQVTSQGNWAVYPMEIRISDVIAPSVAPSPARLPSARLPSDAAVLGPLREYLCGVPEKPGEEADGIRRILRRNAREDLAIARRKEAEQGREAVANQLLLGLGLDVKAFCAAGEIESPIGPEWYLRARDFLYKGKLRLY